MSRGYRGAYEFDRRWLCLLLLVPLLVLLAVATAPMFHWLWWGVFWLHPIGWGLILVSTAIFVLLIVQAEREGGTGCAFWGITGFLIVFLIFYLFLSSGLTKYYLVRDLVPQEIAVLPETTEVRYLPMPVAQRFGENKIQESRFHLGDMDPLDQGGRIDWVAPRVPTGPINKLVLQTDGFQVVYPDGQVETVHQSFKYGEGMWITDNLSWQLWKIHYLAKLPEVYYIIVDDEILAMAPYINYRFEFPVRVPYWGGVFVVHPDGRIEDLTPEQAIVDPRFVGQRLFPEDLALQVSKAWAYRQGVRNAWFTHRDQTEVPFIQGEDNQMPYLLPTSNGPVWFVGLEPYGPAYSIFKVLIFDAHSGQVQLYNVPNESGLTGPNKAGGYVRSAFPQFQWYVKGGESSSGSILAIEPKPFVRVGRLFWQMSITNVDYANVVRTVLVDAETNEVVYFDDPAEIEAFISGSFLGRSVGQQQVQESQTSGTVDVESMSDSDLVGLLKKVVDEIAKRSGQLQQSIRKAFEF